MTEKPGAKHGTKEGLVKNVFALGILQVANFAVPLLTLIVISRIIGPDKVGVINWAASFVTYFTLLINFGFDQSATRVIAINRDNLEARNRIFNQVFLAKILLLSASILIFAICFLTVPQLKEEKAVSIFSFLICFSWVLTPTWLYQGMQELPRIAVLNVVIKIITTVIVLIVVRTKSDYVWQPLALSLSQIGVGIYIFFAAIRRYHIKLYWAKLHPVLRLLWNEKLLFLSALVIHLYTTTNTVLLGFLQDKTQVGWYSAGARLITVAQTIISIPLSQALFPFIGSAFAANRAKGIEVVRQLFPIVTLITLTSSLIMWVLGPYAIILAYGKQFAPAVGVFRILAFIPLAIGWSNLLGIQTMINLRMDKQFFMITAIGAAFCLVMNFVLVPRFGYIGSAWSWMITELLITTLMLIVHSRHGNNLVQGRYFHPNNFRRYIEPILVTVRRRLGRN